MTQNFKIRGDSYYTFVNGPTWEQAESNANSLGGNLITINNLDEYNWGSQNLWSSANLIANGYNNPTSTVNFVGFNDKSYEGNYQWSSGEDTDWQNLTDLISAQNWFAQQGSFGGWDHGMIIGNNSFEIVGTDARYTPYQNRGNIVLVDNEGSFYKNSGYSMAGIAEVPLSYFSVSDLTITEGDSGNITISRTGGSNTVQNLSLIHI